MFSTMSNRRAQEGKSWEVGILRQLAYAKAQEDAALRREILAQVKTLQARTREVGHLINVLDYKINIEETEAKACMDKAYVVICTSQQQGLGTEEWMRLSQNWYLERAQEHRDRAKQLTVTKDSLVVAMEELKMSAKRQLLLASQSGRSQVDDFPQMSSVKTKRQSDMKQLALHNNLLALLEAQRKATSHQQERAVAQEDLCLLQQKSTYSMKAYYNSIKCTNWTV